MRRHLLVLAASVWLLARPPLSADSSLILDRFRDLLDALRTQAGIPGLAAAIVGTNDIVWMRAFGLQNVERSVAARTDTPFHVNGVTEIFTTSMVLRCVEEGRLSLDDRIGQFKPDSAEPNATVRQVLTHTSGPPDGLVFAYRPDRLDPLSRAIAGCAGDAFRTVFAGLLERLAMTDSVPGPDMVHPEILSDGVPSDSEVKRYAAVIDRLASPYAVDKNGHASPSSYSATTITPSDGLISTVQDLARFDLALKGSALLSRDTIAQMWQPPLGRAGQRLPHGMGWFVQAYAGETIAWQFGMNENASSSLVLTAPAQGLTLVLLANSDGLVKPYALAAGDVTVSPFAKLFLGQFIR
jgi:CubicO group peptidase (beta-lactamase class C family)